MTRDLTKKFFVDTRKRIIENAENTLNESLSLYKNGFFQRSTFLAMTCIEECRKLWMVRLAGQKPESVDLSKLNNDLHNHTTKTLNLAMGFL